MKANNITFHAMTCYDCTSRIKRLIHTKKHRVREEFVSFEKNEVSLGAPSTLVVFPLLRPRCQSVTTSTEGSHLGPGATQPIFGALTPGRLLVSGTMRLPAVKFEPLVPQEIIFAKPLNPILGFGENQDSNMNIFKFVNLRPLASIPCGLLMFLARPNLLPSSSHSQPPE